MVWDYMRTGRLPGDPRDEEPKEVLFEPPRNPLLEKASLWLPNIEQELIAYLSKHPDLLYELAPRKFEEVIAAIFKNQRFNVELTPQTRDGGFDVIAVQKDDLTGESRYLIECKRYAARRTVDVGVVRSLYGVVTDQKATKGIIATTAFFTKDARKFEASNRNRLSLNDYAAIVGWLKGMNGAP